MDSPLKIFEVESGAMEEWRIPINTKRRCLCETLKNRMLKGAGEREGCCRDSVLTNAGVGSNLNINGSVECDASIMEGRKLVFGAVGAISGVKNPVEVSATLVSRQLGDKLSLGRLHPSVILGKGAKQWAGENGIKILETGCLITDEARKTYQNHKRKLDIVNERETSKKRRLTQQKNDKTGESCDVQEEEKIQDTLGAIVMDTSGNIASAVSSGGISLKQPGRLGPAATYGAGCWAYNQRPGKPGVTTETDKGKVRYPSPRWR
ncbi:threonine aspartase 1-like [Saccostrea echinata]|uniref:threonine aspartase 1-like n=1 Tax=Saccostrea echinata TaxID=191078 RepID=UPI002A80CD82|nr:threonine aspartase 1-like [Saccostrea echinata]